MKRIGTTSTGNIILEATPDEYNEFLRKCGGSSSGQASVSGMSHDELVTYVADRLRKLAPKKHDTVIRSIQAMFQFNGGISPAEVEKVLASLQKRKILTITTDGKVSYSGT